MAGSQFKHVAKGRKMQGSALPDGLPPLSAFIPATMDLYPAQANPGSGPGSTPATKTGIPILIASNYLSGSKLHGQQAEVHTHCILCDPSIAVQDTYGGAGYDGNNGSLLAIPTGVANYYSVVFSFVIQVPNLGRRRVILADRSGTPGDWSNAI
jgi:hypothetical protein